MTVADLIEKLKLMNPELEVMTDDVVAYKDLNYVSERTISQQDADDHGGCEGRIGEIFCRIS